ncbi:hypothetical protein RCL_jg1705.t1 [Rhizophagus clarus]|uniref:Uncharacterized protein n=1 Tax=Rhizophagus clarus TaxID=94130 RepID=A0A8H3QI44_9GLOM|nr:hypothetical protein RCL_jg1705.t1 [Rhizophagus clarus]
MTSSLYIESLETTLQCEKKTRKKKNENIIIYIHMFIGSGRGASYVSYLNSQKEKKKRRNKKLNKENDKLD